MRVVFHATEELVTTWFSLLDLTYALSYCGVSRLFTDSLSLNRAAIRQENSISVSSSESSDFV
jgi:hypothetical protein